MTVILVSNLRETLVFRLHDTLNTSLDQSAGGTTENTPPISPNLQ